MQGKHLILLQGKNAVLKFFRRGVSRRNLRIPVFLRLSTFVESVMLREDVIQRQYRRELLSYMYFIQLLLNL